MRRSSMLRLRANTWWRAGLFVVLLAPALGHTTGACVHALQPRQTHIRKLQSLGAMSRKWSIMSCDHSCSTAAGWLCHRTSPRLAASRSASTLTERAGSHALASCQHTDCMRSFAVLTSPKHLLCLYHVTHPQDNEKVGRADHAAATPRACSPLLSPQLWPSSAAYHQFANLFALAFLRCRPMGSGAGNQQTPTAAVPLTATFRHGMPRA